MRVFLSWSGLHSQQVAKAFAEWLPSVLQSTEVFISTGGINAGERWLPKISRALDEIDFGFVFVTEENREAPWLLFEAGALAKNVQTARVVPVLCNMNDDIEFKKNPLSHFQYVSLEREGVFRALKSLYDESQDTKLSEQLFERALATWWPHLEQQLIEIKPPKVKPTKASTADDRVGKLEESVSQLIGEVRQQNRILADRGRRSQQYTVDAGRIGGAFGTTSIVGSAGLTTGVTGPTGVLGPTGPYSGQQAYEDIKRSEVELARLREEFAQLQATLAKKT